MSDRDGGNAFPKTITEIPGMTLRDYFAGQALVGLCTADDKDSWPSADAPDDAAKLALDIASAMIKWRALQ